MATTNSRESGTVLLLWGQIFLLFLGAMPAMGKCGDLCDAKKMRFASPAEISELIINGADVNARDDELSATPLMFAAGLNANPIVTKILIDAGAELNDQDKNENTPIMIAAGMNPNPEVLSVLIHRGADVFASRSSDGWTPIKNATMYNRNIDVLRILIKAGARPDECVRGRSAFDIAVQVTTLNIVNFFLENGADPNKVCHELTPLMSAAGMNLSSDVLRALIFAGADIHAQSEGEGKYAGKNAIIFAAKYGENSDIFELLLNLGADIHLRDRAGKNALDYGLENPNLDVIGILNKAKE